jgi:hypothetical protein
MNTSRVFFLRQIKTKFRTHQIQRTSQVSAVILITGSTVLQHYKSKFGSWFPVFVVSDSDVTNSCALAFNDTVSFVKAIQFMCRQMTREYDHEW